MFWIFSMVLAVAVCGGVIVLGRQIRREGEPGSPEADRGLLVMIVGVIVFALWAGLHTAAASIRQVEAGHVALVYEFGEIVGQKSEGIQFVAPWQMTRTESTQVQSQTFENINSFSAETQDVFIIATLNYRVSADAIQGLYRDVGRNWFTALVQARVNNFFKEEVVKYEAVEVAPNREGIRRAVLDKLDADLDRFSINVEELLIDDIQFREEFKNSIEQKQIATQDALREEERIRQREAEARQAVAVAQGEADAIEVRALAQAEANRLIGESLSEQVIQFTAVQTLSDNIQIALIPSGTGLLLDPATLIGTTTTGNNDGGTSAPTNTSP
jgi:regulator of protease activity HflC (stomatin/prohibitin superfamily)